MTALRPLAAALAAAVSLAGPAPARAHGAAHQVERRGETFAVRVTHHGGEPLAGATYQIIRPGDAAPVDAGKTGEDGWVVFRPDVPGTWQVKVIEPGGHGKTVRVEVDRVASVMPTTTTTTTTGAGAGADADAGATAAGDLPAPVRISTEVTVGGQGGAGVLLTAAGIVVLFLVLRRAQRRNRAGR